MSNQVNSSESGDLLCVILDLNPFAWSHSAQPTLSSNNGEVEGDKLSLQEALDQLLIFCNAHLALLHSNELTVFGASLGISRLLYSSQLNLSTATVKNMNTEGEEIEEIESDSNTYQQFRVVDEQVIKGVKEIMSEMNEESKHAKVGLVGALSMALCHINRLTATDTSTTSLSKTTPRILILSVTEDASEQYVPAMNSIFLAQKKSIPIDVCKIYGPDAVFLQQACHLTSGAYYKIKRRAGLLQYLMMAFLPGPSARKHLTQPTQEQVDLRAACLCHKKLIDTGFVCSVCLSIYCTPVPVCTTCRTKFSMATLKRLGFGSKPIQSTTNGVQRVKKRKVVSTAPVTAVPIVSSTAVEGK